MSQIAERHASYASEFEAFRREPAFGAEPLRRSREMAFTRFLERGFPSTRDEEWRFTNVGPIAAEAFVRAPAAVPARADIAPFQFSGAGADLVVVNGRLVRSLSSLDRLPAGLTVETLADALRGDETLRSAVVGVDGFGRAAGISPFIDLNEAFFEDAVILRVARRAELAGPIHILSLAIADDGAALVLPRIIVHAAEGAQASIVETHAGLGSGRTLTSAVVRIRLEPGAVVDHVKIQRELDPAFHLSNIAVRLDRSSTFTSNALTFGGRIARNDIGAVLDGEGAECTLNGLYVATGDSLVDTHTTIDHAKPHCPSHEVYKGILGGRARAVFNGKIVVRPDAQKTDAKQTNRALLLTDDAQINTKPQLEIFADDVKCTHGAAIGQLDEDAMFYLRARGIDERASRIMLIHAFAGQILDGIRTPAVRSAAMHLVDQKLSIE